ncbi:MAG TPA: DUF167 domain-containing protein [Candidatus Limnocylindria bacterium]|nr:DUF167 domain-containing protein [Candidatus Limnocylindria bacterium]
MSLPSYLKVQADVIHLHVKVQPRASRNEIGEVLGNELKVKITAPPVDSAANGALVRFLAEVFDCPRNSIQLARGEASRHKVITIRGLKAEIVVEKIGNARL